MENYRAVREPTGSSGEKLSSAQLRKIKKPLIEKRRRERINDSLNQLKGLVLDALEKDETEYNKMEKADILEMTVQHLLQLKKRPTLAESSLSSARRYRSGFYECVEEVQRFLGGATINPTVKDRLCSHLSQCMDRLDVSTTSCCSNTKRPVQSMSADIKFSSHQHSIQESNRPCPPMLTDASSAALSPSTVVPVVVQTPNGLQVLTGGGALPSGIIPLYTSPVTSPYQPSQSPGSIDSYSLTCDMTSSRQEHPSFYQPHSQQLQQVPVQVPQQMPSNRRDFSLPMLDSRLNIDISHHTRSYPQSLPGSPVSSRGLDTPSPGSSASERSCMSDVWRPW